MEERVRLLIWDLDETFWHGTLTEGGIRLRPETLEIVRELARRGIVSSICSKNDYGAVKKVLEEAKIWDYFVFPSIDWEPKGPRIADLIKIVQLRPSTVMFIDDNPMNLSEAQHMTAGLQIRSHEFIPAILGSPLFIGKPDDGHNRLQQYKLLEQRKADEKKCVSDVRGFLRSSNIRVFIEHDVEKHLDRAIELINRTNQLNYTKVRLPEDVVKANAELIQQLSSHEIQAGIIRVKDRYGDHGWCGLYVLHNNGKLLHYAFSCRVLGMGVETWLYNRLGRPRLVVVGDVLIDLKAASSDIDWIEIEGETDSIQSGALTSAVAQRIISRGGCDLMAVTHYFTLLAQEVVGEFNENRIGMDGRIDHSMFLYHALVGTDETSIQAAKAIGYQERDFQSYLAGEQTDADVWLLSFWSDAAYVLYRHKFSGLVLPFALPGYNQADARGANVGALADDSTKAPMREAVEALKAEWDYLGFITESDFKRNLTQVLSRALPSSKVFILEANEYFVGGDGLGEVMARKRLLNRWTREVAGQFGNILLFNVRDFVISEKEVHSPYHFDRMVYVRIYEFIEHYLRFGEVPLGYSSWALHENVEPLNGADTNAGFATYIRTALFLMNDKQYADATRLAARALQLEPSSFPARLLNAEIQNRCGNRGAAKALIRQIVAEFTAHQTSTTVLRRLADTLYESGCYPQAEDLYRQVCEREPSSWVNRHRLANALDRQGDKLGAYQAFSSCVEEGDTNPHVHAHAGRLLYEMGRLGELEKLLAVSLQLHPRFPGLLELREKLGSEDDEDLELRLCDAKALTYVS